MLANSNSPESVDVVVFSTCTGFGLRGGGGGGLPVLGSSLLPVFAIEFLRLCSAWTVRLVLAARPPADAVGVGRRDASFARLGSNFFMMFDTTPDIFLTAGWELGTMLPELEEDHPLSKCVLHKQDAGWDSGSVWDWILRCPTQSLN